MSHEQASVKKGRLKRVVLLGDSIRMAYQGYVEQSLMGKAQIFAPQVNGRHAANILRHLKPWAIAYQPDVIHVNAGLHDIRRDMGSLYCTTDLMTYARQVEAIVSTLRSHTSATVIWALITPVIESWYRDARGSERLEVDVLAFNQQAEGICRTMNTPVNDLYTFVINRGKEGLLREDGVHFCDDGYRLLGQEVARVVTSFM